MAKHCYIISLLFFLLLVTITQVQGDHAPARVAAESLVNPEPITSVPPRRPQTYRYYNVARRDGRAIRKPADMSFEALLSNGSVRLTEAFYIAVDYSVRTYYYLQAAREYERVVRNDPTARAYVIELQQKNPKLARSAIQQASANSPGTRTLEIEMIASQAGLLYEEIPSLALNLEGTVRQLEGVELDISELFLKYTTQHPRGRLLVGFWKKRLTLGFIWVFQGCVFNAGRCWRKVDYVVAVLLVGPVFALLHMGIVELKKALVFAYAIGRYQR